MVLKKRKRLAGAGGGASKKARKKGGAAAGEAAPEDNGVDANVDSEDEVSSDDDEGRRAAKAGGGDEEEEFFETPDEKRVRMAKEYLGRIGTDKPQEEVQEQLAKDSEDQAKRSRLQVDDVSLGAPRLLRKAHGRAVTSVCLSADESTAFTGSKDCHVARWDVETGKHSLYPGGRNRFECGGHFQKVLSVCLVESRQLLASAGVDRVIRLWDPRAPPGTACKDTLQGHQGPVTGIAAEEDGSKLYTASTDKSLKIWDLRTKRCTDTMFGHVAGICSMDLYNKGRPVTGGADKSVRLWKVDKETHLMFNRHIYSADSVTVVDQERFLSGGQDGNLFLWSHASKKPLASASIGGGGDRWISALRAVRRGNVAFSGGVDGLLRCWRFGRGAAVGAAEDDRALRLVEAMTPVPVPGCINAIAVGRKVLACAVGKEHRLGRWYYEQKHKNGLLLVPLSYRES